MYERSSTMATALMLSAKLFAVGAFISSHALRKPGTDLDFRGTIVFDVESFPIVAPRTKEDDIRTKTTGPSKKSIELKEAFYEALMAEDRHSNTAPVKQALDELSKSYKLDARTSEYNDGDWMLETRPTFPGLLGYNEDGDALFTMGKLTYNMIYPTNLMCSVQKMTQHIHKMNKDPQNIDPRTGRVMLPPYIPKSLQHELLQDASQLRSVRNDVHFTVEENGVQGVLQMDGFTIPNPNEVNKYSIWFTGGRCYSLNNDKSEIKNWRSVFGTDQPKFNKLEQVQLWMAKRLMGAEPSKGIQRDGSLTYVMKKPVGGHRQAYQQVLYLDDKIRVTVGNKGTIVVVSRMDEEDVL